MLPPKKPHSGAVLFARIAQAHHYGIQRLGSEAVRLRHQAERVTLAAESGWS